MSDFTFIIRFVAAAFIVVAGTTVNPIRDNDEYEQPGAPKPVPVYGDYADVEQYFPRYSYQTLPERKDVDTLTNSYTIWFVYTMVRIRIRNDYKHIKPPNHLISIYGSKTRTECCTKGVAWSPKHRSFYCELQSGCLLHEPGSSENQILVIFDHDYSLSLPINDTYTPVDHKTFMLPYMDNGTPNRKRFRHDMDGYSGYLAPRANDHCQHKHQRATFGSEAVRNDNRAVIKPTIHATNDITQHLGILMTKFELTRGITNDTDPSIVYVSKRTRRVCCFTKPSIRACLLDINWCIGHDMNPREILLPYVLNEETRQLAHLYRTTTSIIPPIEADTTQMFMPCHVSYAAKIGQKRRWNSYDLSPSGADKQIFHRGVYLFLLVLALFVNK